MLQHSPHVFLIPMRSSSSTPAVSPRRTIPIPCSVAPADEAERFRLYTTLCCICNKRLSGGMAPFRALLAISFAVFADRDPFAAALQAGQPPLPLHSLVEQYCADCHNGD